MKPSTARVADVNSNAVARYKEMRAALMDDPGVDRHLCEIVITSQLALLGHENAFKVHAVRLFEMNVSRSQLEQVILAGLGVTFVVPQAAQALDWIEQAYEQYQAANR
jgi:hypothetical protein